MVLNPVEEKTKNYVTFHSMQSINCVNRLIKVKDLGHVFGLFFSWLCRLLISERD